MSNRKVIIYGNNPERITQFPIFEAHNIQLQPLPTPYPPDKLVFFAPFDALFYQCEQLTEAHLETIRAIRREQPEVPLILALPSDCSSVQINLAYRSGVRDCVFAPYEAEELLDTFKHFTGTATSKPSMGLLNLMPATARPLFQETPADGNADLSVRFLGVLRLCAGSKRFDLPLEIGRASGRERV